MPNSENNDIPYELADWKQIEDPSEVKETLRRIQDAQPLDIYGQADLYDEAYPGYPGDLKFYTELGKEGKVLYLGSGSGRIFAPLSEVNPEAVGVDISPEMVALMRKKFPHTEESTVHLGDASTVELPPASHDLVMAPYSFLQVVPEASLMPLLHNIHRSLKPGGKFVTDTFSSFVIPFRRPGIETTSFQTASNVGIQLMITYNHVLQTMREIALVDDGTTQRATEMHLQYYFPRELVRMMHQAGLTVTSINGDYTSESFDPARHHVVVFEAERSAV